MTAREHGPAAAERMTVPAGAARAGQTTPGLPWRRAARALARSLRAHAETWRPYTLAYPGLVGLAGAALAGAGGLPESQTGAERLLVAWAAPTLGWVSGHYLGDWFDRDLDAVSKPQRPLPSGRLGTRSALACGTASALGAAVAAASVNWRTVVLFAVAMAGIVAYSRLFKGRGLTGNVVRGSLTATTVVFGAMTVADLPSWQVLLFAGVFGAQDTASNLVGALRDVQGDRRGGYATLPVRHGCRAAAYTAAALHASALAVAVATLASTGGLAAGRSSAGPGSAGGAALLLVSAAACGAAAFVPLLRHGAVAGAATGAATAVRGAAGTKGDAGADGEAGTGSGAGTNHDTGGDGGGQPTEQGFGDVLDPRLALRSHEILVAERMLLAGALLAAGWGTIPALAVTVPLLAASLLAQARMRSRHEFPDQDPGAAADTGAPQAPRTAAQNGFRGDVPSC